MTATAHPETQIGVSVILCTYNRCQDLVAALESLSVSQMPPAIDWEVLVVDNNSTDQTRNVVESFCRRHPRRFRYHFEPNAGKSYALNAGIASAFGEILAFTDDDAIVDPMWLQNLTMPLRNSEWAGAGGRILPAGKFTRPPWLPDDFYNWGGILCAYFDLGANVCELKRAPYGVNMAFRKAVLEKHGGFRLDLGPRPHSQIRNEDTELGRRLMAAGERLRYEPSAIVYHPVPRGRITKEYFLSWWFDYGQAMIRELGQRPAVCGIPREYLSLLRLAMQMPGMTLRWVFAINPQNRFCYQCWLWHAAGQMVELYRSPRDRKRKKTVAVPETKSDSGV